MHTSTLSKVVATGAITALLTLAIPLDAKAKNNNPANSSSCKGLLTAVINTPANSVARSKILEKLYARNCGEDPDNDGLFSFEETLLYNTNPNNADTDADGLNDGEEVLAYRTDPVVADTDADGLIDGEEVFTYLTDPLLEDTDSDWLLDGEEVNTYNTNPLNPDSDADTLVDGDEVQTYLTDPLNNDTDADNLPDGWEVNGHPNGTLLIDANPRRADIYVEMDYMIRSTAMNGLGPNANVIDGIIEVFSNAPVPNPDGSTGITIHLDLDQEIPYDGDLSPYESEISAIKDTYFESTKSPVYHYMIWANGYAGGSSSGVSLGIPASDFIVTLGLWNNSDGGTDEQKIGTFIHELGHNLGLKHGGSDHDNYKPNYISVMNYLFQTTGIPTPTGVQFDYQRFDLPALDEDNLNEPQGLNAGPEWDGYSTWYHCANTRQRVETLVSPIDWNCDNLSDETVSGDVNRNNTRSILTSQNNWENIDFGGNGVIGLGASRRQIRTLIEPQLEVELTWEQHQDFTNTNN